MNEKWTPSYKRRYTSKELSYFLNLGEAFASDSKRPMDKRTKGGSVYSFRIARSYFGLSSKKLPSISRRRICAVACFALNFGVRIAFDAAVGNKLNLRFGKKVRFYNSIFN